MLINCILARGFKSHFFRVLNFHLIELKYRFYYIIFSFIITFIILYCNKIKLFNYFIPINIYFSNFLEVFWYSLIFILFITFFLLLPAISFNCILFIKPGLYNKEFFYLKKLILLTNIIFFIFFIFIQLYIMPYFIKWSNNYNTEELSMQILFSSYILFLIKIYYILFINSVFIFLLYWLKITRIKVYFYFFLFISLFSPPDIISFLNFNLFYLIFIEFILFLFYLNRFKGL